MSCAHTVLCCAMCGIRVVRTMCEMGVQAQVDEDEDASEHWVRPASPRCLRVAVLMILAYDPAALSPVISPCAVTYACV